MMAKAMKTLELHYQMIQFLIIHHIQSLMTDSGLALPLCSEVLTFFFNTSLSRKKTLYCVHT